MLKCLALLSSAATFVSSQSSVELQGANSQVIFDKGEADELVVTKETFENLGKLDSQTITSQNNYKEMTISNHFMIRLDLVWTRIFTYKLNSAWHGGYGTAWGTIIADGKVFGNHGASQAVADFSLAAMGSGSYGNRPGTIIYRYRTGDTNFGPAGPPDVYEFRLLNGETTDIVYFEARYAGVYGSEMEMGEVNSFYAKNCHVLGDSWRADFVSTQFTIKVFTGGDIIFHNDLNLLDLQKKGLSESNPAVNGAEILAANAGAADTWYWIKPSSSHPAFRAPVRFFGDARTPLVCVIKGINGEGWGPDDAIWENEDLYNVYDMQAYSYRAPWLKSKYLSYSTVRVEKWWMSMGGTDYKELFTLATPANSMLDAMKRNWNDPGNRSPSYSNADYRTIVGSDASVTSAMGTEVYAFGMDLKHKGHYTDSGNSGGRVRAGTILDENPSNTGSDSYPAAGSAMGIAVNGGNPLKVANVGYGGWTEPNIIAADATWSLWVAF